jgi:hypothetical protein
MRVLIPNRGERIDLIAAKPAQAFRGLGQFVLQKPNQDIKQEQRRFQLRVSEERCSKTIICY